MNEKQLGLDGNATFWPGFTMDAGVINTDEVKEPIEITLAGLVEGTLIVKMHEDKLWACARCVLAINGDSTRTCPDIRRGHSRTLLCTAFGVGTYFVKKE